MLRLKTFGSAVLLDDAREPLGGAAAQRRTVALIAVLAVAGDAGLSRDKIIGLLWPDTEPERARHSLTQALYAARRALGVSDLFIVGADVRLNSSRITSDIRELERALDAGALEHVASLYEGPFLDGFFLAGSPDFEQWAAGHRARLEALVTAPLERLARQAEEAGDHRRAGDWWRRLAAIRPLDAGTAVRLMTALAMSGDRAGALQHARVHESLIRQQLELEPDPVVVALAKRLRDPVDWPAGVDVLDAPVDSTEASDSVSTAAEPPPNVTRSGDATSAGSDADDVVVVDEPRAFPEIRATPRSTRPVSVWVPAQRPRRWPRLTVALVLAIVLVGTGVLIGRRRAGAPPLGELPLRQRVVVAPFRVAGADAALGYLRDGMVELLSTRLADDTAARSVDAGAVLGAWRAAGLTAAMDVPRDTVVKLAARLGAERVVIGSVVGRSPQIIVTATVLVVPSGDASEEATVAGHTDSLPALIDRLAAKLLLAEAGEDERLTSHASGSLRALRAYLAGQAALRRTEYAAAMRQYDAALRHDSTFALAALQLSVVAERVHDDEQVRRGLARAWPFRGTLNERDAALLVSLAGPRYPAPSSTVAQRQAWQRVVDLAPGSADAWFAFASRVFHDGAAAGVTDSWDRSAAAVERALSIDSTHVAARRLRAQVALGSADDVSEVELAVTRSAQHEGPLSPFVRWRSAAATKDTVEQRRFRDTLPRLGPANLRAIGMTSQFEAIATEDGARAVALLRSRASRVAERVNAAMAEHALALNRGRPQEALAATTRLQRLQPGSHASLRLRVLDAIYADGDSTAAHSAATELARLTGSDPTAGAASSDVWLADACVLGQWRVSRGDTTGVRAASVALRTPRAVNPLQIVAAAPNGCAELLDAWLAVASRRRDARATVQRLDSLVFTAQVSGDAATYAPILIARLFDRLGDPALALQAVRKRIHMSGWPRYLATALREEGRYAERAGDLPGVREAYSQYLALRDAPEDTIAPGVDEVRSALQRIVEQADGDQRARPKVSER